MKALEYSNEHQINIIPKADFEELTQEVFNVISSNLSKSLGPLGSSATIFNGGTVEATKDGYGILKSYSFNNIYKKMIYNLIKTPCTRLNNTVGDGTTTAITLANAMFQRYKFKKYELETYYRLPRQMTKAWDNVVQKLKDMIQEKAQPLDPEDFDTIYQLAYVTSNGNEEISRAVADVYKQVKSPAIKMKDSPSNKSYIEAVNGFEFPTNAIDNCYVRNQDLTATEKNVCTMIFDHTIDTDTFNGIIVKLNEVLRAKNHKLIIIAPAYDEYMCEAVLGQYVNYEHQKYRELNLILTQYQPGKLTPYQKEDLAIILRSHIITLDLAKILSEKLNSSVEDAVVDEIEDNYESPVYRCIGKADEVLISCKNGCIFNVNGIEEDEFYQEALQRAQAELDDITAHTNFEQQSYAHKIYDARARLLQLQMKNFIYYVGADSALQKQILQDSIDDVIKCLRSATKHGVVPGCQLSVIRSCLELADTDLPILEKQIVEIIREACITVYYQLLIGPDGAGVVKMLPRWQYTPNTDEARKALLEEAQSKTSEIIAESINRNEVFDLEGLEYNQKIITSSETDTMVLTAASELLKILISGNQCIFIDSDINESHQDTVEAYV